MAKLIESPKTYTLDLSLKEAQYLRNLTQNYFGEKSEEPYEDNTCRFSIFDAIDAVVYRGVQPNEIR